MIGRGTSQLALAGLVAVVLSATIALEAITGLSAPDRATASERPVPARQAPRPVAAADQTGRLLVEILARPVFSPDRKPVASAAVRISGLSRLTGVIVDGTQRIAIFAGPAGGRAIAAREGERVGAYEMREITSAGVTVLGPEGKMVITPTFDPAAPSAKPGLPVRAEKARPQVK